MSIELQMAIYNPQQAHQEITNKVWPLIKSQTMAGHQFYLQLIRREDDRTLAQNRFYWGVVLKDIGQQASISGVSYEPEAWHELFKRKFLGYKIKKIKIAGSKRTRVLRSLKSTTDLKVRAMSSYLDKVQAFAATELGVQFSCPNWMVYEELHFSGQMYTSPKDNQQFVIDVETGEIVYAE